MLIQCPLMAISVGWQEYLEKTQQYSIQAQRREGKDFDIQLVCHDSTLPIQYLIGSQGMEFDACELFQVPLLFCIFFLFLHGTTEFEELSGSSIVFYYDFYKTYGHQPKMKGGGEILIPLHFLCELLLNSQIFWTVYR